MAINLTEDINHSGGGKIVSVAQSAGSWQSLATKATFSNFTANTTTKQNLSNGQFFYVLDEGQLYRLTVAGVGPFATYTLNSASFGDIDTGSFVTNNQTSSMSVATASYVSPTFISASAAAAGFGSGGGTATDISALNTFTGSAQTSLSALNSATSSYALKTEISGAFTSVSSSVSTRLTSLETGGVSVPAGTISGSQQITDLGFINQSQTSSMSVLSALTASFISSTFISASAAASGFGTTTLPSGVLSSSAQIATNISGAFTEVSGGLAGRITTLEGTSGGDVTALNLFTGSAQTSLTALNSATSSYVTSANTGSFIRNSQTSSMSVLSALTASFISDIFISASAVRSGFGTALFPSGLLSSSLQIATDISGAFTSLSSSFASRITTLEGAGGGNGIFTLTGSFYSTTNNIQITGSLSVGSGSFKAFEVNSDGFVVLGDMNKDLNTAPIGTIAYSASSFYLIT